MAAGIAATLTVINTQALSARRTGNFGMRHLDEECALYTARRKEKAPQTGEVVCGAEEANTGEELFAFLAEAIPVRALPRNLDGVDRSELCPGKSRVDGREHHAATASTLDHHSRQCRPRARDALRVGKDQGHCGSRYHGVGQSNGRASRARRAKSTSCENGGAARPADVTLRVSL
ncbi:MAG TPA: hypothetical protein VFU13_13090 [Steroidobacteraceae bacterium]|nr:hypothetical protein [Steroidobacteraceae bacterium]